MSDANKQIVRRDYEEVVNTGDVDRIEEFVAADYVEVFRGERHELGHDGVREHILSVRATYGDLHLAIDRQIAEGDWVVTCITMSGVHQREWAGIAPTGARLRVHGVNVDRVVDGRIVEHGGAVDLLTPLLEIGAVRPVGERGASADS